MALKVFLVAGEQSGDLLGARLMAALNDRLNGDIKFAGVGGSGMQRQGLKSLFPLSDIAVVGIVDIAKRYRLLRRRVFETIEHALIENPDVVVIIDSPEFTHPIAKRLKAQSPDLPILNYVCPQVWAWRPGRAKKMRHYIDEVLTLLPFEPHALERLGGPPATYVGHPLVERLASIRQADHIGLAAQLGIDPQDRILAVLPGSRSSEVRRLLPVFAKAAEKIASALQNASQSEAPPGRFQIIIPAVPATRSLIDNANLDWPVTPHIVEGDHQKWQTFRLATAALTASGTATLELALAGTPMAVGYIVDRITYLGRFLVTTDTIVLANLVLGEKLIPEFVQKQCTPDQLAAAVVPLMTQTPQRRTQKQRLAKIASRMQVGDGSKSPGELAADVVLKYAPQRR